MIFVLLCVGCCGSGDSNVGCGDELFVRIVSKHHMKSISCVKKEKAFGDSCGESQSAGQCEIL